MVRVYGPGPGFRSSPKIVPSVNFGASTYALCIRNDMNLCRTFA